MSISDFSFEARIGVPLVHKQVFCEAKNLANVQFAAWEWARNAIAQGAQVYLTSDVKYHDFVDYKNDIIIIDIGHFESEQCTKNIFYRVIQEKFPNFALYYSDIEQNPINYL